MHFKEEEGNTRKVTFIDNVPIPFIRGTTCFLTRNRSLSLPAIHRVYTIQLARYLTYVESFRTK